MVVIMCYRRLQSIFPGNDLVDLCDVSVSLFRFSKVESMLYVNDVSLQAIDGFIKVWIWFVRVAFYILIKSGISCCFGLC